jgi:hypothetical protein
MSKALEKNMNIMEPSIDTWISLNLVELGGIEPLNGHMSNALEKNMNIMEQSIYTWISLNHRRRTSQYWTAKHINEQSPRDPREEH